MTGLRSELMWVDGNQCCKSETRKRQTDKEPPYLRWREEPSVECKSFSLLKSIDDAFLLDYRERSIC